jgi:hypothetical protein
MYITTSLNTNICHNINSVTKMRATYPSQVIFVWMNLQHNLVNLIVNAGCATQMSTQNKPVKSSLTHVPSSTIRMYNRCSRARTLVHTYVKDNVVAALN